MELRSESSRRRRRSGLPFRDLMSDESAPSPETPSTPPAKAKPRARRTSTPRPKKAAKSVKAANVMEDASPSNELVATPVASESPKFPEFPNTPEAPVSEAAAANSDWPEPEAASSGVSSPSENPKRKRRRKKGKGNNAQNQVPQGDGGGSVVEGDESTDSSAPPANAQPPRPVQQKPRLKLDPEMLAKCAWKIYLAEISEEGVALVGDNDAKELSRRCFRLAEIFLEEQTRRC